MPDSEDAKARFEASMIIDYEKWHDGIGYDLDAFDAMSKEERTGVAASVAANVRDWRDLELLDHIGTEAAMAAIVRARTSGDSDLRLAAHRYGPSDESSQEASILAGLDPPNVLSKAIDQAADHPSPRIEAALLRIVREYAGTEAYSAAATLCFLHGTLDSPDSWDRRAFFLKFVEPDSEERQEAYAQLCREVGV
jgi:hypothetical protein